ncbi:MAG: hypothetical protein NTX50_31425 [Candidatus Sumerlaeota bacterium]|nr:hypothetical protein [Candidatus Sumerlaeota bacterium]
MIRTQLIKESNKPIAVILDYSEYLKLLEARQDREDYLSAARVKATNRKWHSHAEIKKKLGIQ